MKINREVKYRVYYRKNVFAAAKNGIEWVLDICFDNSNWWVVHIWPTEPSELDIKIIATTIDKTIEAAEQSASVEFKHTMLEVI